MRPTFLSSVGRTLCLCNKSFRFSSYKVSEVTIPVPGGVLAGKLWEPKSVSTRSAKIPPTICLHGWLDNAGTFDTLLPLLMQNQLTAETTFLSLDLPGHGLTTYCSRWFYDGYIDGIISVQRILKHYGWERVNILGHSFGSIVGFLYNGLFPETVHKYVALDIIRPIPQTCTDTMRNAINLVFEVEERDQVPRRSYKYEDMVNRFYEGRLETISMDGCRILLKRGAKLINKSITSNISDTEGTELYEYSHNFRTLIPGQEGRISEELSEEFADRISSPICYIKGDPGNQFDIKEYTKLFKIFEKNLGAGNIEIHLVPGSHHFHINSPELVAPIISKFLESGQV